MAFTKRRSIQDQFADRQAQALKTWRAALATHVAGKPIDLAAALAAAPLIGVAATEAAAAFDADVRALEQLPELERHAVDSEKAAKASAKAAPTQAELDRMREKLLEMERAALSASWDPVSAAEARAQVARHRQASPRVWDDLAEHNRPAAVAALAPPEPPQRKPELVAATPAGEAWLSDDD